MNKEENIRKRMKEKNRIRKRERGIPSISSFPFLLFYRLLFNLCVPSSDLEHENSGNMTRDVIPP